MRIDDTLLFFVETIHPLHDPHATQNVITILDESTEIGHHHREIVIDTMTENAVDTVTEIEIALPFAHTIVIVVMIVDTHMGDQKSSMRTFLSSMPMVYASYRCTDSNETYHPVLWSQSSTYRVAYEGAGSEAGRM